MKLFLIVILGLALQLFGVTCTAICRDGFAHPGREVLCYTDTKALHADNLQSDICYCTIVVHQGSDLRNFNVSDLKSLRAQVKDVNEKSKFVVSLRDDSQILRNSTGSLRRILVANLTQLLLEVDGVELNFTAGNNKGRLVSFVKGVRKGLTKKKLEKLVIIALPSKSQQLAKQFDLKELSNYVDYVTLSTHYLRDKDDDYLTFHPSRLMGLFDMSNADSLIDLVTGLGAVKSKIIISVPVSAYEFNLKKPTENGPKSATTRKTPEVLNRRQLCDLMSKDVWTVERDEDLTAPYAFKNSTWIAYEDQVSLEIKAKYVTLRGLAGMGIVSMENDLRNECDKPLAGYVYGAFSGMKRKSRETVLSSLEKDLRSPEIPLSRHVRQSGFRVVRVIDAEGKIRAVRENTETAFSCSRQGYFVHPRSCNRFYRCVKFDQGSDDYSVFEFDCPSGLAFDQRAEVCVWPGSVSESSACPGSSEIAPVPRSRFQCPSRPGFYADPENCRWFFACYDLGGPDMAAYEFRCPYGLVFDEQNLICEWPWKVPNCKNHEQSRESVFTYGGVPSSEFGDKINYDYQTGYSKQVPISYYPQNQHTDGFFNYEVQPDVFGNPNPSYYLTPQQPHQEGYDNGGMKNKPEEFGNSNPNYYLTPQQPHQEGYDNGGVKNKPSNSHLPPNSYLPPNTYLPPTNVDDQNHLNQHESYDSPTPIAPQVDVTVDDQNHLNQHETYDRPTPIVPQVDDYQKHVTKPSYGDSPNEAPFDQRPVSNFNEFEGGSTPSNELAGNKDTAESGLFGSDVSTIDYGLPATTPAPPFNGRDKVTEYPESFSTEILPPKYSANPFIDSNVNFGSQDLGNTAAGYTTEAGVSSVVPLQPQFEQQPYFENPVTDRPNAGTTNYNNVGEQGSSGFAPNIFPDNDIDDYRNSYTRLPNSFLITNGNDDEPYPFGNGTSAPEFTREGFTKTGPTKTGITTAQLGGSGSYVISSSAPRPRPTADNFIGANAFLGPFRTIENLTNSPLVPFNDATTPSFGVTGNFTGFTDVKPVFEYNESEGSTLPPTIQTKSNLDSVVIQFGDSTESTVPTGRFRNSASTVPDTYLDVGISFRDDNGFTATEATTVNDVRASSEFVNGVTPNINLIPVRSDGFNYYNGNRPGSVEAANLRREPSQSTIYRPVVINADFKRPIVAAEVSGTGKTQLKKLVGSNVVTSLGQARDYNSPIVRANNATNERDPPSEKQIIKLSDLRPFILGKLGAECTCKIDPFNTIPRSDLDNVYVDLTDSAGQDKVASVRENQSLLSARPVGPASYALRIEDTQSAPRRRVIKSIGGGKMEDYNNVEGISQDGAECARPGLFRHPKYCSKFYACQWNEWTQQFTLIIFNCPVHLSFDLTAGACNLPAKGPVCKDDKIISS